MAIGAAPRGAGPLACTIHIWPSRELIAQSWGWPAAWHEAFERSAGLLAIAAAMCVLNGRPISERPLQSLTSLGHLKYTVVRRGDSILITITEFTGPESPGPDKPGPDGGARQPSSIDGLVVGLRGSGKNYRLVVFHGFMPPIPAINVFCFEFLKPLFCNMRQGSFIANRGKIGFSTGDTKVDLGSIFAGAISVAHLQDLTRAMDNAPAGGWACGKSYPLTPTAMLPELFCNEYYRRVMRTHDLLCQPNQQRQSFSQELRNRCLQVLQQHRQSQFNFLSVRYLH